MRTRLSSWIVSIALCAGSHVACTELASAQARHPEDAAAALLAVDDADPLELARIVHRFGDASILVLLEAERPASVRLAAVRAAPWLAEPEQALPALSAMIATRESDLAPAAARATLHIARLLDADALSRHELLPAELRAVVTRLRTAAEQGWVREDLRLMAALAAAQLEAAGVPPSAK
jgi:hypothetical protein